MSQRVLNWAGEWLNSRNTASNRIGVVTGFGTTDPVHRTRSEEFRFLKEVLVGLNSDSRYVCIDSIYHNSYLRDIETNVVFFGKFYVLFLFKMFSLIS